MHGPLRSQSYKVHPGLIISHYYIPRPPASFPQSLPDMYLISTAYVYIKKSVEYRGPPSESYLTAIRLMLEEAGHSTDIEVCMVSTDGSIGLVEDMDVAAG
jgi:hypothetical protein